VSKIAIFWYFAQAAPGLDVEPGRVVERFHQQVLAALDLVPRRIGRLEIIDDRIEHFARLGGIVGAVIAHVDVERQAPGLGPGVDRQVRLGQHHRAGVARALELVEAHAHDREPRGIDELDALFAESLSVEQELRIAAAAAEVTDEMQTVHFLSPRKTRRRNPALSPGCALPSRLAAQKRKACVVFNSCRTPLGPPRRRIRRLREARRPFQFRP
jgi:hypothetical protein